MKCPVCHEDKYKEIKGLEEKDYDGSWVTTQPDTGFCSNCHFHYKESNDSSFKEQVKNYKKVYFMRKIVLKKNDKEVII